MRKIKIPQPKETADRREWDFSSVPSQEQRACCFYEYARESRYIIKWYGDRLPNGHVVSNALQNSPLTYALPPRTDFHKPWLAQDDSWHRWFCEHMAKHWEGLSYARILPKTPDRAFHVGISQYAPWQQWTEQHTRLSDKETGLDLLLITIDWANFENSEIIEQFTQWVESEDGRPHGVTWGHMKGKRRDFWQKKLERLAVMRLRHYYKKSDWPSFLPEKWQTLNKFIDGREIRRERQAARGTLFELFPFLPKDTVPVNWSLF